MKKFGWAPSLTAMVCIVVGLGTLVAQGRTQYSNTFKEKYCDPQSKEPAVKKLTTAVETAKCNTCHVGTKSKKDRNKYAQELAKLLEKNEKAKDKIEKAFEEAEKIKIDENDPKSKTYGDLLKEGLLPAGEEAKK